MLALALGGFGSASAQQVAAAGSGLSSSIVVSRATDFQHLTGTYTGSAVMVTGGTKCKPGGTVRIMVQDGRFRLPWTDVQSFDARISADGSFYATSGSLLAQSDKHMMTVPNPEGRVTGAELMGLWNAVVPFPSGGRSILI